MFPHNVSAAAAGNGLSQLPLEHLEHEITELASRINAGTCRWLLLVGEFDRRRAAWDWGCHSTAKWLSWRCGVAPRAAREHVRVARRLGELERVREAFASGELSYSKVRAITRVASEETEELLLEYARHATAAQLERIVRAYRGVLRVEEAKEILERRYLAWSWEDDGSLSFRGRIPAEEGALLLGALDAARDALNEQRSEEKGGPAGPLDELERGGSAEPLDPPRYSSVSNADALSLVLAEFLSSSAPDGSAAERYQVVVHVDAPVLADGEGGEEDRCQLEDGSPLAAETARRLSCDSSLVRILEDPDGRPLSVGRRTRTIPPRLRRALRARDEGCRFPGCTNRRFLDAHHVHHWAAGGETSLDNLVHLCRRHHRLVHEGGFSLQLDQHDGLRFFDRWGQTLPNSPSLPRARESLAPAVAALAPGTGERYDLDLTILGLCAKRERASASRPPPRLPS